MSLPQGVDLATSWLDWRGQTAVVIATGPSANSQPLDQIRGRARIIAVNDSWRLAPWADVLYACDRPWWIERRGVPEFGGLKISASPAVCKVCPDVRLVTLVARAQILTETIGKIGCGLRYGNGHSGFHAVNLAVQFGAKRIVLVGFDMRLDNGVHWHADRVPYRKDGKAMSECREALDGCAPQFAELGVDVLNASPISALQAYRKVNLMEAIAG